MSDQKGATSKQWKGGTWLLWGGGADSSPGCLKILVDCIETQLLTNIWTKGAVYKVTHCSFSHGRKRNFCPMGIWNQLQLAVRYCPLMAAVPLWCDLPLQWWHPGGGESQWRRCLPTIQSTSICSNCQWRSFHHAAGRQRELWKYLVHVTALQWNIQGYVQDTAQRVGSVQILLNPNTDKSKSQLIRKSFGNYNCISHVLNCMLNPKFAKKDGFSLRVVCSD